MMNKEELIKFIKDNIEYLTTDGTEIIEYKEENKENRLIKGHPNFYLIHTKEEFDNKLSSIIQNKDKYDRYDIYYYMNYMFKYMLDKYDSHTKIDFYDNYSLPIRIRIINNFPYIIDEVDRLKDYNCAQILKINDIDINIIMNELEKIICYASPDYLKLMLEGDLKVPAVLNSLPCFNKSNAIKITTNKGEINFDLNNHEKFISKYQKNNYNLDIIDDTAIITYNSCSNEQQMINLVNKLNDINYINHYIVDLRGNGGGYSYINNHLVKFLKDKDVIVLSDERVFSSARMCLIDLKNNGAKIIGTNPGTPISCFGNNRKRKKFDDLKLTITGSVTYWYYDKDFNIIGVENDLWNKYKNEIPNLLDTVFFNVDEKVEMSLDDYKLGTDSVLEYALNKSNSYKLKK